MSIEFWLYNFSPRIGLPTTLYSWLLLAVYVIVFSMVLLRLRHDFAKLRQHGVRLAALLGMVLVFGIYPLIRPGFNLLPLPGVPGDTSAPGIALLGMVAPLLAAGFLGIGPAVITGMLTGLLRALLDTHQVFTFFEWTFAAYIVAFLIRQDYQGSIARLARQPLAAAGLAGLGLWALSLFGLLSSYLTQGLIGINYGLSIWQAVGLTLLVEFGVAGIIAQAARMIFSHAWHHSMQQRPPPWALSVRIRLAFLILTLGFFGMSVLIVAEYIIVLQAATQSLVTQMGRDASNAADSIPFFMQTGRQLIQNLASDLTLHLDNQPDTISLINERLAQDIQSVPYFRQLWFFDTQLQLVTTFPADAPTISPQVLQSSEVFNSMQLALSGVPGLVFIYPPERQATELIFIAPVGNTQTGAVHGVLIGEAVLINNPILQPLINTLSRPVAGSGQGFLIDENNIILYHPLNELLQQEWQLTSEARPLSTNPDNDDPQLQRTSPAIGEAYLWSPDGNQQLVYIQPVRDPNWRAVIIVPYTVVLTQASRIIIPLLVFSLGIGTLILLSVLAITGRVTRPLETLALATRNLAQADFSQRVTVAGDDEVGQLGVAFEHMRISLRARVDELNLLLRVTQSAADSLNPERTLPPILDAAQLVTGADSVRLIAIRPGDEIDGFQTFANGAAADEMAPLDNEIAIATRALIDDQRRLEQKLIRIENVQRARTALDLSRVQTQLQALVALPLVYHRDYLGALWLGYSEPHAFSDLELSFLTTLAGQAAVAIANASLYEASEGGRQRLSAVLASTPDAVIVTDERRHISLFNPIAATVFGVTAEDVIGKPLANAISYPALLALFETQTFETQHGEIELNDGRTFYASASPILMLNGTELGRVIVMRDVTHFKELDQLKSDFVATVSHDLRAPLTFIHGYASMLPMVGTLNNKQSEFVDKIQDGIAQVTHLVENLLDLNRIEAGVGLVQQNCQLLDLIQDAIRNAEAKAQNKGVVLQTNLPSELPLVSGDAMFLRQAIFNLVDNAIKYTPSGGQVEAQVNTQNDEVILAVRDTGIGIAPADQVRLFEKFYRVKRRETAAIKGTGLGLAIVKSIAERHGGRVWVESRLGQGSTFYFSIPRLQIAVST